MQVMFVSKNYYSYTVIINNQNKLCVTNQFVLDVYQHL